MSRVPEKPSRPPGMPEEPEPEPVGSAHLRLDGVLELRMGASARGGIVGEALFIIKPGDARYESVREHLGPMEPGGYAPVLPFPPGTF
ncbi:hypothetical protein OV207_14550 [Corallococcus sp. BB11-1]|uniref:hypothetical protein n=1 Tax=Corallococcus sp. BB11-1 TaxID=2996783 RepID=UPI0010D92A23|nr:hypothetical protein [Corallococcus sp. BB11-1]MCY1032688.1 hypothetical protein [Corallococcus sp. BB11-1]RYZ16927.1 MAG: hypothetical protein EOO70_03280 [Myxococcaceae bacterium]